MQRILTPALFIMAQNPDKSALSINKGMVSKTVHEYYIILCS